VADLAHDIAERYQVWLVTRQQAGPRAPVEARWGCNHGSGHGAAAVLRVTLAAR